MGANTPFLNLYKPGGGSLGTITPDEVMDIDRVNGNSDLIDAFASGTDTRLDGIENTLLTQPQQGTTAQRDAKYGTPATAAAQAALANQKVVWFNTDLGWLESYYAPTGTSGLTALGLVATIGSGWFPMGPGGPRMFLAPSAQQTLSTGAYFTNWTAPGTGVSWRKGGAAFLDLAAGVPKVKIAGRYAVDVRLEVQNGAGTGSLYLTLNNPAGVQASVLDQDTLTLNSSQGMMYKMQVTDWPMSPDDSIRIYAANVGSAIFAQSANGALISSGFYYIRYVGPALVSN